MTLGAVTVSQGHWNLFELFSSIQRKNFCVLSLAAELQLAVFIFQRLLNPQEDHQCFAIKGFLS